jgi:hypothetical protein
MWIVLVIGIVIVALAHTAPAPFLLDLMVGERAVWHMPRSGPPTIYLTYDDGPNPTTTPDLLELLAREGVHATFFIRHDVPAGNRRRTPWRLNQQNSALGPMANEALRVLRPRVGGAPPLQQLIALVNGALSPSTGQPSYGSQSYSAPRVPAPNINYFDDPSAGGTVTPSPVPSSPPATSSSGGLTPQGATRDWIMNRGSHQSF